MTLDELTNINPVALQIVERMPEYVKNSSKVIFFQQNMFIVEKGEPANSIYIFCEGEVEVINNFENGRFYVLKKNTPESSHYDEIPDFFGSIAILGGRETYASSVLARSHCTTIRVSRTDFSKWFHEDFSFAVHISKLIAKQHCDSAELYGNTRVYPIKFLMVKYLMESYRQSKESELFILKDKRRELAGLFCSTERTINRTVKFLQNNGFIQIFRGKIAVSPDNYKKMLEKFDTLLE